MRLPLLLLPLVPLGLALAAVSCGGGSGQAAQVVMPKQAATPDAITCDAHARYAEPLIVDLDDSQRGEIETAMGRGVVVVSYDCKHLQILSDCHIDGEYGFQGMSIKQNVIRIDNSDDLQANLPSFIPSLAAKIEAGFQSGQELDVAVVLIGAKRTTWVSATPRDLLPDVRACAGATHFLKGALLGAFTRATGQKGHVSTVAEVFGAGVQGASSAMESVADSDGQLADCQTSAPDADAPPKQCRSPIRLQLTAIDPADTTPTPPSAVAGAQSDAKAPATAPVAACPGGFVRTSDGACKRPRANAAHMCDPKDQSDCQTQCDAGDATSCTQLGILLVAAKSYAPAQAAFQKACDAGHGFGCFDAGVQNMWGEGIPKSQPTAAGFFRRACDDGLPQGCLSMGWMEFDGGAIARDFPQAAKDLEKGCRGGLAGACVNLGVLYVGGSGLPKDDARAARLFKAACDGGEPTGCNDIAYALEAGMGVPVDLVRAKVDYEKSCQMGSAFGCFGLAEMYETGVSLPDNTTLVAPDDARAHSLYTQGGALASREGDARLVALATAIVNVVYGERRNVDTDGAQMLLRQVADVCQQGAARLCARMGILYLAMGDHEKGAAYFRKACDQHDRWGCFEGRRLKL